MMPLLMFATVKERPAEVFVVVFVVEESTVALVTLLWPRARVERNCS